MQVTTNTGPRSHSTAVLMIILVSYFMIVLDISIVITALPKINQGLGFSVTGLSWVQKPVTDEEYIALE